VTTRQRDPVWFTLRLFRFTSSTSCVLLRRLPHCDLTSEQQRLLVDDIGISLRKSEDEDPTVKYAAFLGEHSDKLKGEKNMFLKEMMKSFNIYLRSKITTKEAMIKAIKEAAQDYQPPSKKTEFEEFLCATWLQPVNKASKAAAAMETGSHNEQNIIRDLRKFLEGSNVIEFASDPIEFGLVAQDSKQFLATSVDGLAVDARIFRDTGDCMNATVALEFKTLSSQKRINDLRNVLANVPSNKHVLRCQFGDETFKILVHEAGYRVQVLHHATVLKLNHVLYCVATSTSIQCCLLVNFVDRQRETYESILTFSAFTVTSPCRS
jgi:hypothetical protein